MNRFTQLTLMILLLGITSNVSPQEMLYKTYKEANIPFYDDIAVCSSCFKRQTAYDTLWLPVYIFVTVHDSIHSGDYFYEYHENGLLKKARFYDNYTGELVSFTCYNNT